MAILIFIEAPPHFYARMRKYFSSSDSSVGEAQESDRSSSPDTVPTTPPNRSVPLDNDSDEERGLSDDNDNEVRATDEPPKDNGKTKVQSTPYAHGTASQSVTEMQTEGGQMHKVSEDDAFLKDDLRCRIFVDIETFLVKVLRLPADWRNTLSSEIAALQNDEDFGKLLTAYLEKCDVVGLGRDKEREPYRPYADLFNHAIGVLRRRESTSTVDDDGNGVRIDPIDPWVVRGSMAMVKPDLVGVTCKLYKSPQGVNAHDFIRTIGEKYNGVDVDKSNPNGDKPKPAKRPPNCANYIPGWPQVLEVIEMKGTDDAIDEGHDAIRLKTQDDKDPLTMRPKKNRRYLKDKANVVDLSCPKPGPEVETAEANSRGRKRKAEAGLEQSTLKASRTSKTVLSKTKVAVEPKEVVDEDGFPPGTNSAEKARIQCARYGLHMLSNTVLRSHAFGTLIDRDRVQPLYYDRSAILVCQAIDLARTGDQTLFMAMLIGSQRLTLEQRGVLNDIIKDPYIDDFERFNEISKVPEALFSGLELKLQKDNRQITVELGDLVYRQRGLFGRHTCVIRATCPEWAGKKLVVKLSWPSTTRKSEKELVDIAIAKANEMAGPGKTHWILNHLPNILHQQDFTFDKDDSVQKFITDMVNAGHYVGERNGTYEERVLRVTVMEELFPITHLQKGKQYAQVFFDILQCHRWLYDHSKILHRDISIANIMFRIDSEGVIFGVLNDFDLASLIPIVEATSLRRTGTPPYMAFDLLREEMYSGPHLYRHDLEALFYVMLMICCRHSLIKGQPSGVSQLQEIPANFSVWFDRQKSWNDFAAHKRSFLTGDDPLPVSRCFEGLHRCLDLIRSQFKSGFTMSRKTVTASWGELSDDFNFDDFVPPEPASKQIPFDDDTLGGHIKYGMFLLAMRRYRRGELIMRNSEDPAPAAPSLNTNPDSTVLVKS